MGTFVVLIIFDDCDSQLYRAYEERAQGCPSQISLAELRGYCSDWTSKYEVWPVENETACVADISIPLDIDEVWLQMRQNLILQHTWKVHFPIEIGSSAQVFSVLRKVYYLELLENNKKLKVKSASLSIDFNKSVQRMWSTDPRKAHTIWGYDVKNCSPRTIYLYWLCFSPDGQFVFFLDQHNKQSNAAVFEVMKQVNGFKLELVSVTSRISSNRFLNFHLNPRRPKLFFHPSERLVAFSTCGSGLLWPFSSS
jgi:hypothetical protein